MKKFWPFGLLVLTVSQPSCASFWWPTDTEVRAYIMQQERARMVAERARSLILFVELFLHHPLICLSAASCAALCYGSYHYYMHCDHCDRNDEEYDYITYNNCRHFRL